MHVPITQFTMFYAHQSFNFESAKYFPVELRGPRKAEEKEKKVCMFLQLPTPPLSLLQGGAACQVPDARD